MSDQLNALIAKYNEKADVGITKAEERIAKREAELVEWQEYRAAALNTADSLGVAETFNSIYLEAGGLNSNNFRTLAPGLMDMDDDFKKQLHALFKRKDAPNRLESAKQHLISANEIKRKGAEAYLLEVRQGIGKSIAGLPNPNAAWETIIKSQEGFADLQSEVADDVEGPRGIFSSPELYTMIVEQGNPLSSDESEEEDVIENPINEEDITIDEPVENTLNPDEIEEEESDDDDPLNQGEGIIVETEPENEVESTTPELETELTPTIGEPTREDIDNDRGFVEVEEVSAINPEAEIEDFNTDNNVDVTIPEYNETAPSVINDIAENVSNEVTNIQNQINEAIEGDTRSELREGSESVIDNLADSVSAEEVLSDIPLIENEAEQSSSINEPVEGTNSTQSSITNNERVENYGDTFNESETNELNEESSTNINTVNPSVESSNAFTEEEDPFADIALLREHFGMTDDSVSSTEILNDNSESSSNIINDSVSADEILTDNSISEGAETTINSVNSAIENTKESALEMGSSAVEVAKSKIGLDKKIAPINTPKTEEPEPTKTDSVTATEVVNDNSNNKSTETSANTSSSEATSSETNTTNNSASAPVIVDMSGMEARLRKIENLLSGPLEVKIVE